MSHATVSKTRASDMGNTLAVGMRALLASLLDATVAATEYKEKKKGLAIPAPHEGDGGSAQS
jgi:hypothetical protein